MAIPILCLLLVVCLMCYLSLRDWRKAFVLAHAEEQELVDEIRKRKIQRKLLIAAERETEEELSKELSV